MEFIQALLAKAGSHIVKSRWCVFPLATILFFSSLIFGEYLREVFRSLYSLIPQEFFDFLNNSGIASVDATACYTVFLQISFVSFLLQRFVFRLQNQKEDFPSNIYIEEFIKLSDFFMTVGVNILLLVVSYCFITGSPEVISLILCKQFTYFSLSRIPSIIAFAGGFLLHYIYAFAMIVLPILHNAGKLIKSIRR